MIEEGTPYVPEVFRTYFEESKVLDRLDDPDHRKGEGALPKEIPDWVKDLLKLRDEDPKRYAVFFLFNDLRERCLKGTLLQRGETPESFVTKARQYDERDVMRKWYLRQAATEYLVAAERGDLAAQARSQSLLIEILDHDKQLAEAVYPKLIELIQDTKDR